jgi:hypothetical protein
VPSPYGRPGLFFYRAFMRSMHVTTRRKAHPLCTCIMRSDTDAIGGFFEDLPVLAFVLAGVLSVSGTATWVGWSMEDAARERSLEDVASSLVSAVVLSLRVNSDVPTVEHIAGSNLSAPIERLGTDMGYVITVWCVHPYRELLLSAEHGWSGPSTSGFHREFMNVACPGGLVGVVEVRALVWYTWA